MTNTNCPAKPGAAPGEAGHWPDPKSFRNPTAVAMVAEGTGHANGFQGPSYLLRLTCNCVHCGAVGEIVLPAELADIEWEETQNSNEVTAEGDSPPSLSECFPSEEPEDFDPSPTYPWGNSPPRGNYPADNE